MRAAGLAIPMVTGNFDLLFPDRPNARPLLAAMDQADVRLLKLGYFPFDPLKQDYWQAVDEARAALEGWEGLGREFRVRVCYHTHSHQCLGLNCAALAHLLHDRDPEYIGAYVDPCHLAIEGEDFARGVAMVRDHLSIVALKDVLLERVIRGSHGGQKRSMVPAGRGVVDWTAVFAELQRLGFTGPLTVHGEFLPEKAADPLPPIAEEIRFFRACLRQAAPAAAPA